MDYDKKAALEPHDVGEIKNNKIKTVIIEPPEEFNDFNDELNSKNPKIMTREELKAALEAVNDDELTPEELESVKNGGDIPESKLDKLFARIKSKRHEPEPFNIENALAKLGVDTFKDLAESEISNQWLIKGILEGGAVGVLAGSSMAYKSFAVIDMCYSVATGKDFLDFKTIKTGAVIYVAGEGANGIKKRVKALNQTYGIADNFYLMKHGQVLHDEQSRELFIDAVKHLKPSLVVFDTYNQLAKAGASNNSANDVTESMNEFKALACQRELNNTVLIVHHFGKQEERGIEGSHAFTSNSDFTITFKRNGDRKTLMNCGKMKDSEEFETIPIDLETVGLGEYDDDDKELTSLIIKKGKLLLVDRAEPKKDISKANKTDQHMFAFDALHETQKTLKNANPVVQASDIKLWLEKYTPVTKYNRSYMKRFVENGDLISCGEGQFKAVI